MTFNRIKALTANESTEILSESAIIRKADVAAEEITDEELDELELTREDFRNLMIGFGEALSGKTIKLDMQDIEKKYIELTKIE